MDYDLYIKHEEERQKFSGDIEDVPEEKFNDEYEDRIHQDTVLEDIDIFDQDFVDVDALGEAKEQKFVCCICGEPSEGYGNNPSPYKEKGRCCDSCNLKFVIPARYDEWQAEYSWPTLEEPDEVE
jgi:formylmethanofuran dehydrogenase subunit E